MAASSLLGGVPATVVRAHQVQVPSRQCPPQGHLVVLVPEWWAHQMRCSNLEVRIPAAGHNITLNSLA